MTLTTTHTAMGYRAEWEGNRLIVYDVPIFCACTRGEFEADEKWVAAAVEEALQGQRDGYEPPMHVWHTDSAGVTKPKRAGRFRITRTGPITLKGARRVAVFADLIVTDEEAQQDILDEKLPYRSVEIFDVEKPKINTLALLDTEAPFFELPMLMVRADDALERPTSRDMTVIPGQKREALVRTWSLHSTPDETSVACFRRGSSAHLLFREETGMSEEQKPPEDEEKQPEQAELFADGDDKKQDDKSDDEKMESAPLDVAAVVKAIESGEISVADMDAILAAIQKQGSDSEQEPEEQPAPAAVPGGESMKADGGDAAKFAAMQGKIDALEAKDAARDASDQRKTDVAEALELLRDKPLGSDLEGKLVAFHTEHGGAAFKAYVDSMAQTFAAVEGELPTAIAGGKRTPDVAMKFAEHGPGAVERAAKFAAEAEALRKGGMRCTVENYVASRMKEQEALTNG